MLEKMMGHLLVGARGHVDDTASFLSKVQELFPYDVLCMNAEMVCGREHVESALEHARRAIGNGTGSSSGLMMETMLYASGEKQLAKARDKMGLKVGTRQFALLFIGAGPDDEDMERLGLLRDDAVLDFTTQKALNFGIGSDELASVPENVARDLVLERVAFVDVIKR